MSSFDLSFLDEPVVPARPVLRSGTFSRSAHVIGRLETVGDGRGREASSRFPSTTCRAAPRKVLPVTLECAENPVGGGLVSHAEWTGVPLASLIERAQAEVRSANFVRLSGADGFSRNHSNRKRQCIPTRCSRTA